jgi:hypothetical protein
MRTPAVLLALLAILAQPRAPAADGMPPLADPTRPPGPAHADAGRPASRPLDVSAVFLFGSRPIALVDGRLLAAGDRIGSITIEAVLADGVRYRTAGGRVATQPVGGRAVLVVKTPSSTLTPSRDTPLASTGAHAP